MFSFTTGSTSLIKSEKCGRDVPFFALDAVATCIMYLDKTG